MENKKNKHYGVLFNRKNGKIVKIVKVLFDDYGSALLKMFAMGNVSSSRDYIVFNEDGVVVGYYEGKKNDMPTICHDMEGKRVEEFGFSVSDFE